MMMSRKLATIVFAVACLPLAAHGAATSPYREHVQQLSARILTFSVPTTGYRIIRNISCIVQLTSKQPQTPVLIIGNYGAPDFQAIYVPMSAAGPNVFVNTTPILAYVYPGETVQFEAGLASDVPVNLGCTLTGNDVS